MNNVVSSLRSLQFLDRVKALSRSLVGHFFRLGIGMVVIAIVGITCSNAAPESAPAPPLVAPGPNPGSWSVDVTQKKAALPPSKDPKLARLQELLIKMHPRMVQENFQQLGSSYFGETTWEDGTKDTLWNYRGLALFKPRYLPADHIFVLPLDSGMAPHKPGVDFPDLTWISAKAFVGTTYYEETKCYLYKETLAPLKGGDTLRPPGTVEISAWIDAKTRLPLAVEDDALKKTFKFSMTPPVMELGGQFALAYDHYMTQKSPAGSAR